MNTSPVRPSFSWVYSLLAYGISWLIWSPAELATHGLIQAPLQLELLTVLLLTLGAVGPLLAAFVLTAREGGRAGTRSVLARGRQWRIGRPAFLVLLTVPLAGPVLARAQYRYEWAATGVRPCWAFCGPSGACPCGPWKGLAWRGHRCQPTSSTRWVRPSLSPGSSTAAAAASWQPFSRTR